MLVIYTEPVVIQFFLFLQLTVRWRTEISACRYPQIQQSLLKPQRTPRVYKLYKQQGLTCKRGEATGCNYDVESDLLGKFTPGTLIHGRLPITAHGKSRVCRYTSRTYVGRARGGGTTTKWSGKGPKVSLTSLPCQCGSQHC